MNKYSKSDQILITILGGWFGLHYYIDKQYLKGLIYTFTIGIFYIGWFIDIIKVCKKKNPPVQNNNFNNVNNNVKTVVNNQNNIKYLSSDKLSKIYADRKTSIFVDSYIVIDTETTGLDVQHDKIIEISAIKYINNKEINQFNKLINPKTLIDQTITNITGITNDMLKDKPVIKEILPEFIEFIEDYTLVAHNASYDLKMIASECYRNNINIPKNKIIDTLTLAKRNFSKNDIPNYKLQTFKKFFNLDIKSHRALDDCYTCAKLYQYCLKQNEDNRPQLNEDEIKALKIVNDILTKHQKNTSMLRGILLSSNVLSISLFHSLLKIKCRGKLKYILLDDIDLSEYNLSHFEITEAKKSDNAQYRLKYNNVEDIYYLENLIVGNYEPLIKSMNEYIFYVKDGKREYEQYLNNGYKL